MGLGVHELALTGGFFFSHRDVVGGGFSGLLFGLTNTVAQIAGFVSPMLITALTPNVRKRFSLVFLWIFFAENIIPKSKDNEDKGRGRGLFLLDT